jgi:two-component system, NtrC family, sensor kinase
MKMRKLMEAQDLNNILVVDDTPQNLHLLVDILKKYNYKVRPVPNGKLALSAAEISPPDLILLDIMMPDLDGYQVCKQLKSNEKTRDIPVIFISAINEPVDKVKAFAVGGVDYITKPFQMHEVLIRVKNQLSIASLQQQLKSKNEQLNNTINQLKQNQKKLIKSEKYLAVDKVISGITNQVNHPLSEIKTSLGDINHFSDSTLKNLPIFFQQISPEQQKYFAELLKQAQQQDTSLTESEKQKLKAKIITKLNIFKLQSSEKVADMFINLGCTEEIEAFLPLLTGSNYISILENACTVHNLHTSIKNITDSTAKFTKLVSAFEDYSSGMNNLNNQERRQAHITNTIEMALNSLFKKLKSEIKVIKNYSDLPAIYCYPEELQKIWANIIKNSLDTMGEQGTLTINVNQQQNYILVSIIDTGSGIAKEIVNQICDPFFTTKSPGEGVGLGLTVVKQIIEKHDGTIAVNSLPGKTKFTVSLPFIQ